MFWSGLALEQVSGADFWVWSHTDGGLNDPSILRAPGTSQVFCVDGKTTKIS